MNPNKPTALAPPQAPPAPKPNSPDQPILDDLDRHSKALLVHDNRYYIRTNDEGLLEKIDIVTGQVEVMQKDSFDGYSANEFSKDNFFRYETTSGEIVLIPKSMKLSPEMGSLFPHRHPYNPIIAERIINLTAEGRTFKQILAMPGIGISYNTFYSWRKEEPEFDKALAEARRDRKEVLQDRVLDDTESLNAMRSAASFRERLEIAKIRQKAFLELSRQEIDVKKEERKVSSEGGNMVMNIQVNTGFSLPPGAKEPETIDLNTLNDENLE